MAIAAAAKPSTGRPTGGGEAGGRPTPDALCVATAAAATAASGRPMKPCACAPPAAGRGGVGGALRGETACEQ